MSAGGVFGVDAVGAVPPGENEWVGAPTSLPRCPREAFDRIVSEEGRGARNTQRQFCFLEQVKEATRRDAVINDREGTGVLAGVVLGRKIQPQTVVEC